METGCPLRVAGRNRQRLTASIAFSSRPIPRLCPNQPDVIGVAVLADHEQEHNNSLRQPVTEVREWVNPNGRMHDDATAEVDDDPDSRGVR